MSSAHYVHYRRFDLLCLLALVCELFCQRLRLIIFVRNLLLSLRVMYIRVAYADLFAPDR